MHPFPPPTEYIECERGSTILCASGKTPDSTVLKLALPEEVVS